ncbi:hypothetical protein GSF26_21815 [Pseudonocardia alni]|nr:hypothetical protein [Pseudonocardia alni]
MPMTPSLSPRLLDRLEHDGYLVFDGCSMRDSHNLALSLGAVSTSWELLTPKSKLASRRNSLSGVHGYDQFPWHSDGAVGRNPPDYIVLWSEQATVVEPTEILNLRCEPSLSQIIPLLARTVLLAKSPGRYGRYLPALLREGEATRIRWDERSCPPVWSGTASKVSELIASADPTGQIDWRPGRCAVIDNRTTLHRRPSIRNRSRRLHRLYISRRSS